MKIMAWGMVIYAVGFSMYGFVSAFWLFIVAMVIITFAEMLVSPTGQAIVAKLSPEDMRGQICGYFWVQLDITNSHRPLVGWSGDG